jgi:hypothetical protein
MKFNVVGTATKSPTNKELSQIEIIRRLDTLKVYLLAVPWPFSNL